jgi:hypothetical protein
MNSVFMSGANVGPVASASLGMVSTRNALPKVGVGTPVARAGSRSR